MFWIIPGLWVLRFLGLKDFKQQGSGTVRPQPGCSGFETGSAQVNSSEDGFERRLQCNTRF